MRKIGLWTLPLQPTLSYYAAKAIDRYVGARSKEEASGEKIDPKLQGIIEGLLRRCISEGEYKQASKTSY